MGENAQKVSQGKAYQQYLENTENKAELTDRLTHFSPMSHFYTPEKRQKTIGFLTFSGGIEM